ncbi:Pseudouridine synthase [uncultured Gammaproteobacteria bacterium]
MSVTTGDLHIATTTADDTDTRLDRWLRRRVPGLIQAHLEKLLRNGRIRVDDRIAKANTRLQPEQAVSWPADLATAVAPPPKPKISAGPNAAAEREVARLQALVLYRDADVLVLNKPAGLAVQGGTGTSRHLDAMLDALKFEASERPRLVHRLDKDTSGVLILARSVFAAAKLAEAFRSKTCRKTYCALTAGVPNPFQGRIDLALSRRPDAAHGARITADEKDGQSAVTLYQVLDHAGKRAALVAMWPLTGRTHQLRVHMAELGTPILGDDRYGITRDPEVSPVGGGLSKRLHLHAFRLEIPHPRSRKLIDVQAPFPPDLVASCRWLGFQIPNEVIFPE